MNNYLVEQLVYLTADTKKKKEIEAALITKPVNTKWKHNVKRAIGEKKQTGAKQILLLLSFLPTDHILSYYKRKKATYA